MTESPYSERLRMGVERVRGRIADACRRAGRGTDSVRLVAVTKYVPEEIVAELVSLGVRDIGESRVQQLAARAERLGAARDGLAGNPDLGDSGVGAAGVPNWHLIGHLQRNKVKALLPHCRIVHSLDSIRLAEELNNRAEAAGLEVDVLMEINVSREASKTGAAADEAFALAESASKLPRLRLRGLMTMAPPADDPDDVRPFFAGLRQLRDRLIAAGAVDSTCRHLSMGMSGDYEVAIEEGATIVRVGSALFERPPEERASMRAG